MSCDFTVAPGTIIKEYMEARGISIKDLVLQTETSEEVILELLNGKAKLSEKVAIGLEKVFPELKAKFWIDLEFDYRLNLSKNKKSKRKNK